MYLVTCKKEDRQDKEDKEDREQREKWEKWEKWERGFAVESATFSLGRKGTVGYPLGIPGHRGLIGSDE